MAGCSQEFKASRTSGTRFPSAIKWIVVHDEEAANARSAAQWFANPNMPPRGPAGSAHLAVDDIECYRCLDDSQIPWGAPGANTNGLHIEQAGFAAWKKWQWLKHKRQLDRVAYRVALWCVKYNIPAHFCNADDLVTGRKGITTHAQVSKAFGGTHTDPGLFYPKRRLMRKVRRDIKKIKENRKK